MMDNFKDILAAACIIIVIPILWVSQGLGYVQLDGEVIGATIMAWGLILRDYFNARAK